MPASIAAAMNLLRYGWKVLVTSYPLPGILRWFPVTSSETYLVSPLRNAIETMEATNIALRDLIISHRFV